MCDKTTQFVLLFFFPPLPPPPQFPGHGELLRGEAKARGQGSAAGLRFYAVVRVLQRLQERLGTTKQEHLQREVSRGTSGLFLCQRHTKSCGK